MISWDTNVLFGALHSGIYECGLLNDNILLLVLHEQDINETSLAADMASFGRNLSFVARPANCMTLLRVLTHNDDDTDGEGHVEETHAAKRPSSFVRLTPPLK